MKLVWRSKAQMKNEINIKKNHLYEIMLKHGPRSLAFWVPHENIIAIPQL